jgi:electron transfer flavoprotein beta subunit
VPYNCVVLVKQVPDTQKISGKVMKDDGTVNRAALPAIFNPEDLNALELALQIKDEFGGKVTAITMGLPSAAETLRQALYRGADEAILVTDPKCAGSDTLATSYILACAVKKTDFDIVLCGRQAIDGDTAQVGPQMAEKIGIPQITYIEELSSLKEQEITVRRNIGNGFQVVKGRLPVLLTVLDTANEPRVGVAKKMMTCKNARTPSEIQKQLKADNPHADQNEIDALAQKCTAKLDESGSLIRQWTLADLDADLNWCGLAGSPTKVHRIQSVVLTAQGVKDVDPTDEGISNLIHELIEDKAIS